MALNPTIYGDLLRQKFSRHNVACWLVNTGWSGGPYEIGNRIQISYSRALINAALDGTLAAGDFETDPVFGLRIPTTCSGVPSEVLNPRSVWPDTSKYDETAGKLVVMFRENFKKYVSQVPPEVAGVM